jgi:type IV pilus assembly protein PilE
VTKQQSSNRTAGFTLMELLTVMVVVSILAAIAVPTYQSQMRHSRRTEAKTAVMDLAAREEKYFSLNNTYTASPAFLGYVAASSTVGFPQLTSNSYYNLNVCLATATATTTGSTVTTTTCSTSSGTAATGNQYIITAVPVTTTTQGADSACQYFAVDNTGTQYASSTTAGGTDTTSTCWH